MDLSGGVRKPDLCEISQVNEFFVHLFRVGVLGLRRRAQKRKLTG